MRKDKLSEFIYSVDLDHESGTFGIGNFKTFYDREQCMKWCESMAKNNPDISVSISVRPRFRKYNALAVG